MKSMFFSCESLNNVYLNFDTSKVTRMDFTFYDCPQLVNLDISNFNLENITTARNMFAFSSKLKEIKFKENTITNNLEEITEIFSHCESLEKIKGGFEMNAWIAIGIAAAVVFLSGIFSGITNPERCNS